MKIRVSGYSFFFALMIGVFFVAFTRLSVSGSDQNIQYPDDDLDIEHLFIPLFVKSEQQPQPQSQPLLNGDFEQGAAGWGSYSERGWIVILPSDQLPVTPHSGNWAVWLGGDLDEVSGIWQQVSIPENTPYLTYWLWIASTDYCGYDVGGVSINFDIVVDAYYLCYSNNTNGWIQRTLDLRDFAGQTVELVFLAGTDSSFNSNLFIDDVSFSSTVVALDSRGSSHRVDGVELVPKITLLESSQHSMNRTNRGTSFSELVKEYQESLFISGND